MIKQTAFVISLSVLVMPAAYATELTSLAARAYIGANQQNLYAGVRIRGDTPQEMVFRVRGPSLQVPSPLPDPKLTIYNESNIQISSNDNWQSHPTAARLKALGLAPTKVLEPAVAVSLLPGLYTVVAESANGQAGDAVLEVGNAAISADEPYSPGHLAGVWRIYVKTTVPETPYGVCADGEGFFYAYLYDSYEIEGFVSFDDGFGTVDLSGEIRGGLLDGEAVFDGAGTVGNIAGAFANNVGSGSWSTLSGCAGWWIAYQE